MLDQTQMDKQRKALFAGAECLRQRSLRLSNEFGRLADLTNPRTDGSQPWNAVAIRARDLEATVFKVMALEDFMREIVEDSRDYFFDENRACVSLDDFTAMAPIAAARLNLEWLQQVLRLIVCEIQGQLEHERIEINGRSSFAFATYSKRVMDVGFALASIVNSLKG